MSFGAIVTAGESNRPLDADLAGALAEVRVEQLLDGPSRFALRFLDDISDGRPAIADDSRLAIGTILSVLVETGDGLKCLIRGPVTDHRSELRLGGRARLAPQGPLVGA